MADDKLNQHQAPNESEITTGEITEDDLEQISGGMESGVNLAGGPIVKGVGNLVNGDGAKKNQFANIPASKTIKL